MIILFVQKSINHIIANVFLELAGFPYVLVTFITIKKNYGNIFSVKTCTSVPSCINRENKLCNMNKVLQISHIQKKKIKVSTASTMIWWHLLCDTTVNHFDRRKKFTSAFIRYTSSWIPKERVFCCSYYNVLMGEYFTNIYYYVLF